MSARNGMPSDKIPGDARLGDPLSPREVEVLDIMAQGYLAGEVAEKLSLSVKTVSTYTARAKLKLGARNNLHVVTMWIWQKIGA